MALLSAAELGASTGSEEEQREKVRAATIASTTASATAMASPLRPLNCSTMPDLLPVLSFRISRVS